MNTGRFLLSAILVLSVVCTTYAKRNREEIEKIEQQARVNIAHRTSQRHFTGSKRTGTILECPMARKSKKFHKASQKSKQRAALAEVALETTRLLALQGTDDIAGISLKATVDCHPSLDCSEAATSRYRTYNGSCNNINNPTWGQAVAAYRRQIESDYCDGITEPRCRRLGDGSTTALPNARKISVTYHGLDVTFTEDDSLFLMQWGQFLDHDITHTPTYDDPGLACCPLTETGQQQSDMCYSIDVDENDPFYGGQPDFECIPILRSMPGQCETGPREQLNQITAYIDGSVVYGSHLDTATRLREHNAGLMKTSEVTGGRPVLPKSETDGSCQDASGNAIACYDGGDERANEQLGLQVFQVLFLREHNRIAAAIGAEKPEWEDEKIFQEARRILGAELQIITQQEFLPGLFSREDLMKFHLDSASYLGYNTATDATIDNSFSTAAYRFGHSMVGSEYKRQWADGSKDEVRVSDTFFNPTFSADTTETIDPTLKAMSMFKSWGTDRFIVEDLRNQLFRDYDKQLGQDLSAINIQRGREHGMASYMAHRRWAAEECDVKYTEVSSINDLPDISQENKDLLIQAYGDCPECIDLFPGGLAEYLVPGANLGPLFSCIIGKQFEAIIHGDRYWYQNAFTPAQIAEIRKVTLAGVICDNTDITEIQPSAFHVVKPKPKHGHCEKERCPKPCSDIESPNISVFLDA